MAVDSARGLRSDAQRNAERLVEVATHVFAEQGPEAPFSEIARAAGVGTATLYRRFPTREALLAAVRAVNRLELMVETLRAALNALAAAAPAWLLGQIAPAAAWLERYGARRSLPPAQGRGPAP